MKLTIIVGVILIVFGVIALTQGGFSYTDRDKVVDIGPVEVQTEEKKTLPFPPVVGGAALALGAVLVVVGATRRH
jgi:hypothetical protein